MSELKQRLEALRVKQNDTHLQQCDELLREAGVPEWVEIDRIPSNTVPARLKWFLMRRKAVKKSEIDIRLNREMEGWRRYIKNSRSATSGTS